MVQVHEPTLVAACAANLALLAAVILPVAHVRAGTAGSLALADLLGAEAPTGPSAKADAAASATYLVLWAAAPQTVAQLAWVVVTWVAVCVSALGHAVAAFMGRSAVRRALLAVALVATLAVVGLYIAAWWGLYVVAVKKSDAALTSFPVVPSTGLAAAAAALVISSLGLWRASAGRRSILRRLFPTCPVPQERPAEERATPLLVPSEAPAEGGLSLADASAAWAAVVPPRAAVNIAHTQRSR